MYGQKLDLITMQCKVCGRWFALRVDPADVERHANGMFVQHAFADCAGRPYLDAELRELFISAVGPCCWPLLCSSNPLDYD